MTSRSLSWKWLFISLFTLNILIALLLIYLVAVFPERNKFESDEFEDNRKTSEFVISTDKVSLTNYVNRYLENFYKGENLDYYISLNEDVELNGELTILGRDIPFQMTFSAEVQPNGDVLLTHKSIRLGDLRLPVKTVLQVFQESFKFPEEVTISPDDRQIYVALSQFRTAGNLRFSLISFDLENDHIELKLFLD